MGINRQGVLKVKTGTNVKKQHILNLFYVSGFAVIHLFAEVLKVLCVNQRSAVNFFN